MKISSNKDKFNQPETPTSGFSVASASGFIDHRRIGLIEMLDNEKVRETVGIISNFFSVEATEQLIK